LVVVDQLEEVFGRNVDIIERDGFLDALVDIAEAEPGRAKVLVALRSDFYPHLDVHRRIAEAAAAHQHRLLPLDAAALRDVVVLPAEQVGLRVEPALVEHVLDDVAHGANQLPLLAFAMRETWRRRRNGWLTLAGYVEAGGVGEALEQGAQSVWQALSPEQRATAKRTLLRLTSTGEGRPPTRQRRTVESLVTDVDDLASVLDVLERFTRERLLVPDVDAAGHPTVDIAHEALLREWSAMRGWLDEDVAAQRLQREVAQAAQTWRDGGGEPAGLLGRRRLEEVDEARRAGLLTLNEAERAFVDASASHAARDRRRNVLLVVLPLLVVLAVAAAGVVMLQQRRTEQQKTVADALQLAAQARSLTSTRRDTAALLAVAAFRTDRNPTTAGTLIDVVTVPEGPLAFATLVGARATAIGSVMRADGTLAVGASDGSLRFVSATGAEVGRVQTGLRSVSAVDVAADGTVAVGGSGGGVAVLLPDARDAVELDGPSSPITTVAVDPTRRIVVATAERELWRWSLDAGSPGLPPIELPAAVRALVATRRGDVVAATDLGAVLRIDIASGAVATSPADSFSARGPVGLAARGDGNVLLVDRSGVRQWDVGEGRELTPPDGITGLTAVAVAPDGSRSFVGTASGEIQTWTLDPRPLRIGAGRGGITGSVRAVATDGPTVAALEESGRIVIWDADVRRGPSTAQLTDHRSGVIAVAGATTGAVVSGGLDGSVRITAGASDGRWRELTNVGTPVRGLAWAGSTEVVIGAEDGSVRVVDTVTGTTRTLAPAGGGTIAGVAAAAEVLAWATTDGAVTVARGGRSTELLTDAGPVTSVAVARDGRAVAVGVGAPANAVVLWELDDVDRPAILGGHGLKVTSVAFSPAGDVVASGSDDQDIRLWATGTRELLGVLSGHTDLVQALAFGADGTLLASGSEDFTVRVWDVPRRRQLGQPWRWMEGPVRSLSVAADGRSLLAANGPVVVQWAFDEDGWVELACRLAGRELTSDEWATLAPSLPPSDLCAATR
jgi:WD40 repeat protein